jgi:hypothetical protein
MDKPKCLSLIALKVDTFSTKVMKVSSPEVANILYNLINAEVGSVLESLEFKAKASGAIANFLEKQLQQTVAAKKIADNLYMQYNAELEVTRSELLQIEEMENAIVTPKKRQLEKNTDDEPTNPKKINYEE